MAEKSSCFNNEIRFAWWHSIGFVKICKACAMQVAFLFEKDPFDRGYGMIRAGLGYLPNMAGLASEKLLQMRDTRWRASANSSGI